MDANKIQAYLSGKLPEMLDMLENLVNRNTSSDYKPGVDEAGELMAAAFRRLGYDIEVLRREHCGNGVIARKPGDGKQVLLICHLDSVFSEGTDYIKPFSIDGNRAYGAGVVDMKACLVGCLYALMALDHLCVPMPGVTVLMSGDEEKGSEAVLKEIREEGEKADYCIVTEGSRPGMAIVTQRKGNAYMRVKAHGRAAHAGNEPQVGRNAIDELALKITCLRELGDENVGTTFTVTQMQGGQNRIVVPEEAFFHADIRFYTMAEWNRVSEAIKSILSRPEIDGVRVEYDLVFNRPPLTLAPGTEKLHRLVEEASGELGIPYLTTQPGGVSDGNFVSAMGTPTVDGMGPTGGMMCSPEEFLEIDTMIPCAARLASVIAKIGQMR